MILRKGMTVFQRATRNRGLEVTLAKKNGTEALLRGFDW